MAHSSVWVLVSGALSVRKRGMEINRVTRPGSVIGEVSLLLGARPSATIVAVEATRLRLADDGRAFLLANPEVMHVVAKDLAERLNFVTTYLADLKAQYGDAPGLSMVPAVLQRLAERKGQSTISGSARDPDPEY